MIDCSMTSLTFCGPRLVKDIARLHWLKSQDPLFVGHVYWRSSASVSLNLEFDRSHLGVSFDWCRACNQRAPGRRSRTPDARCISTGRRIRDPTRRLVATEQEKSFVAAIGLPSGQGCERF